MKTALQRSMRYPLIAIFVVLVSCNPSVSKRPYGYIKIGKLKNFLAAETYLEQYGLLLRRDVKGFYIMSTYCTKDLSHLKGVKRGEGDVLECPYDKSTFDRNGNLLTGPAVSSLPYYQLEIAADSYEGNIATLYVKVGEEVPKEWRLEIPGVPPPG